MPHDPHPASSISPPHWIRLHGPWQMAAMTVDQESDSQFGRLLADDDFRSAANVDSTLGNEQQQEWVRWHGEMMSKLGPPQRISFPKDWCRWQDSCRRDHESGRPTDNDGQGTGGRSTDCRLSQSIERVDHRDARRVGKTPIDSNLNQWGQRWFWLSRHFGCPTGLSESQTVNLVLQNFLNRGMVLLNSNPLAMLALPTACVSIPIRTQLLHRNQIEILVGPMASDELQLPDVGGEVSIGLEIC